MFPSFAPLELCVGGDMGIGVQREACGVVSEHTADRFHVHAVLQGRGSEGVTEIVESDAWGSAARFSTRLSICRTLSGDMGLPVGDGNTHSLFPILHFCIFSTFDQVADSGSVR